MRSVVRPPRAPSRTTFIAVAWFGSVKARTNGMAPAVTQKRPQQFSDFPLSWSLLLLSEPP